MQNTENGSIKKPIKEVFILENGLFKYSSSSRTAKPHGAGDLPASAIRLNGLLE